MKEEMSLPSDVSIQFWKYHCNNCAPATFFTVMELVCQRLSVELSPESAFGKIVASRLSFAKAVSRGSNMHTTPAVDDYYRHVAGVVEGVCSKDGHAERPQSGCCAYQEYCTYTIFVDEMLQMFSPKDFASSVFQCTRQSMSKMSLPKNHIAHYTLNRSEDIVTKGNVYFQTLRGIAPSVLHVS